MGWPGFWGSAWRGPSDSGRMSARSTPAGPSSTRTSSHRLRFRTGPPMARRVQHLGARRTARRPTGQPGDARGRARAPSTIRPASRWPVSRRGCLPCHARAGTLARDRPCRGCRRTQRGPDRPERGPSGDRGLRSSGRSPTRRGERPNGSRASTTSARSSPCFLTRTRQRPSQRWRARGSGRERPVVAGLEGRRGHPRCARVRLRRSRVGPRDTNDWIVTGGGTWEAGYIIIPGSMSATASDEGLARC
jgi:hypothetical protein